jgi:hypothetical protein
MTASTSAAVDTRDGSSPPPVAIAAELAPRLERDHTSSRIAPRLGRLLGWLRDRDGGASWEPGHDWLTRAVPDIGGYWRPPPGDRQETR